MDPARYQRLMSLFDQVCDQPPDRQRALVQALRAEDPELGERLAKLLEQDASDTEVLEPAGGARALALELQRNGELDTAPGAPDGPATVRADRVGAHLGQWVVGDCLGSGGVGSVHRATHSVTGQVAAIKFLKGAVVADATAAERLKREFSAISRLDHRGCLKVYEDGHGPFGHYFVMEYVGGGDLRRFTGAPAPVLLRLLGEITTALSYIHSQGIVHRDLKPANVLLTSEDPPQPKLADFGIAKVADTSVALTSDGTLVGSLDFLAPEQIQGTPADARSDLYALGCTIFALFTGETPFAGDQFQRLRARVQDEPRSLAELAPQAPPALVDLTRRLLARDPSARPASAAEVAAELAAIRDAST